MPKKLAIGEREFTVFDTAEVAEMTGYSWSYIKTRIGDGTIPAIAIPSRGGGRVAKYYIPDYVVETIPATCYRRQPGRPKKNYEEGKELEEFDPADFTLPDDDDHSYGDEITAITSEGRTYDPTESLVARFKRLIGRA